MSCHALAFGPHPDDVEIGCGGTVAKLCDRGHDVRVVDLTAGELATNGTVAERAHEADAAAKVLGVTIRENLGLPDGRLSASDDTHVNAVVDALRRHRPAIVLAPWRHARHPDHAATSALVERAVFLAGLVKYGTPSGALPFRPSTLLWYPLRVDLKPSFVVDISATVARKRAAIGCYQSQVQRDAGQAETLVNAPQGHAALIAREGVWGGLIGAAAGEAFATDQMLSVDDPVSFFANGAPPTLLPRRD
ncbi:MAG: bacillithiol biosynthesis deacetylase BshB1 [Myxococcota bacterium]|jgi:bacillithiol biosynthesis deacetylase BshB1